MSTYKVDQKGKPPVYVEADYHSTNGHEFKLHTLISKGDVHEHEVVFATTVLESWQKMPAVAQPVPVSVAISDDFDGEVEPDKSILGRILNFFS